MHATTGGLRDGYRSSTEMLTRPNDGGGTTLVLAEGDDLDAIPESHRDIVTTSIRDAFRDPASYFANLTDEQRFRTYDVIFPALSLVRVLLASGEKMTAPILGEPSDATEFSVSCRTD